jgi:hypothetical protein
MPLAAALALALLALLVGAAIGHLTMRRHRDAAAQANARVEASEAALAKLRHDIRGALSPALLSADRLTMSEDPATARAASLVVDAIERVSALLDANRKGQGAAIAPGGSPDLNSGRG